ncbi:hypothetical protein KUW04_08835 [Halomonas denitrificans]|nr:hypothetical protein [Halomonas denitrificans]
MESKKSVNVRYSSRPIKVAFIVPLVDDNISQWILDGIFHESYSRWGGTRSLIIPFCNKDFICDGYLDWLELYDPDFVYSFVDLTPQQTDVIHKKSLPISMIRHEVHGEAERWRQFIPSWPHGFTPIRSISTIKSPYANYHNWSNESQPNLYIAQHFENDESRLLPDNFGIFQGGKGPNFECSTDFNTVCYCEIDLPPYHDVGKERCHSLAEIISRLACKQAKALSKLSSINVSTINHPNEHEWDSSFNLFVGDTISDRLNFWNGRLLSERTESHHFSNMCISKSHIEDEAFLNSLGEFINRHNFRGNGSGSYSLRLRSMSLLKEECESIAQRLRD